jgi:YVTN family beta-propeller protein
MTPSEGEVYVTNSEEATISVLNNKTSQLIKKIVVGKEPEGMAISSDGKYVVATSQSDNMLHFINAKKKAIIKSIKIDARPRFATFSKDSKQLWVSSEVGEVVTIIDVKTKEATKKIKFKGLGKNELIMPAGIVLADKKKLAFVALGRCGKIAVIDLSDLTVEKYVDVGKRVVNLALSSDEKKLYTANGLNNDITVINVKKRAVENTIKAGNGPWGIVVK